MKSILVLLALIFFQSCSFDNKSGIWINENDGFKTKDNSYNEFKTLSSLDQTFNEKIEIDKNFKFNLSKKIINQEWKDIFYNQTNNLDNFNYNNLNQLIFKSKRITKYTINDYILFENNNIISSDQRGNIVVFSVSENKVVNKFNFYKKQYKEIKKYLNIVVENDIIYVADNIGYLYAFDYKKNEILWAKNYKVPFRSNIKISNNKLISANLNNDLLFLNKVNGELLATIPTEETIIKNKFINNISITNQYILYLNTYGTLYAIDRASLNIRWFLNLNQSLDLNPSNLFSGNQIINHNDKIVISSNDFTYILDEKTGSIIHKKNFSSSLKPVVIDKYLFLISKRNLLIATDITNGKIIYSHNINDRIADFIKTNKKKVKLKNIMLADDKIFIFLKNSYVVKFNIKGNIEEINKLPSKINSNPIFINSSMLFLDYRNKLSIVD